MTTVKPARAAGIALALGAISSLAFQPVGWWPLMPLALAALLMLLDRVNGLKSALLAGWAFGVGQFVVGLNWIATAFTFQAAMPTWLGWVAVVLLSLYLAVYPMIATGLALRFGRNRPLAAVLAIAGGWAIAEWLRGVMFTGFPWNPVGVVLADTPWLNLARFVGTFGLSALVCLVGGAVYLAVARRWREAGVIAVVAAALLFVPPAALKSPAGQPIRIVQPNIGQEVKWTPGFDAIAADRLDALSRPGGNEQELVFWPEAAVTEPLSDTRPAALPLVRFERQRATRAILGGDLLLTGGITLRSSDGRRADAAANSVFVLGPDGKFVGRYDKAHLVPYGEYLPMRPILSAIGLSRLAPGDGDFQPGPGPRTLALPGGLKAGFQVCYEIVFPGHVIERNDRPDFLFNPSNDAWFGYFGPPQHLAQARLRAAEEGIPVIRSTPTGISGLIDAHGRLLEYLPWKTAGVIRTMLPPAVAAPGPFARLGNALSLAIAFVLLFGAIALDGRRRYSTAT